MRNTIAFLFAAAILFAALSPLHAQKIDSSPSSFKGRICTPALSCGAPGSYFYIRDEDKKMHYIQPLGIMDWHPSAKSGLERRIIMNEMDAWLRAMEGAAVTVTDLRPLSGNWINPNRPIYQGIITFTKPPARNKGKATFQEAAVFLGYGRVLEDAKRNPRLQNLAQLEKEAREAKSGSWATYLSDEEVEEGLQSMLKWYKSCTDMLAATAKEQKDNIEDEKDDNNRKRKKR